MDDDIQRQEFDQASREREWERLDEQNEREDTTEVVYLGHEKDKFEDVTETFTSVRDEETSDPDSKKY